MGGTPSATPEGGYVVPLPSLSCLTYPWEWPWTNWKAAALTTLHIQKMALQTGFSLRDATPLNLTYEKGQMRWFDQLSLGRYEEGAPWSAYTEFIQGFLAPLLLMAWADRRLGKLLLSYSSGIPLDLAYALLPPLRRWHPISLIHLRIALRSAVSSSSLSRSPHPFKKPFVPKKRLHNLIESLHLDIENLSPRYSSSSWEGYESDACPYPPEAQALKKEQVDRWTSQLTPKWVIDLGAHTGTYTKIALQYVSEGTIAIEADAKSIDALASRLAHQKVYPIWADIAHPSPELFWGGRKLPSLMQRLKQKADMIYALALMHHLRFRALLPYQVQAKLFSDLLTQGGYAIIEYIPPDDPQIPYLHTNPYIFDDITEEGFLQAFSTDFRVLHSHSLPGMGRKLFLMQKI